VPMMVGNLGPATFGRDDNALLLIEAQGSTELPGGGGRADKLTLARALVARIAAALPQARG
jgi:phosphopantothenoylcysteine decarboxylase/phosphopantothenate--cysteine ligase